MRNENEGAREDEAALRRLIAEGAGPRSVEPGALAALARVLNAASAPAFRTELGGEEAALAAFRRARAEHSAAQATGAGAGTRRPGRARTAALGVIVTALLGSGVAAASGGLPFASGSGAAGAEHIPSASMRSPSPGASAPGAQSPPPAGAGPADPGAGDGRDKADRRNLMALCHAYTQRPATPTEEALDSPALRPLVTAAGSRSAVDADCTALLVSPTPSDPGATEPRPTTPGSKSRTTKTQSAP